MLRQHVGLFAAFHMASYVNPSLLSWMLLELITQAYINADLAVTLSICIKKNTPCHKKPNILVEEQIPG